MSLVNLSEEILNWVRKALAMVMTLRFIWRSIAGIQGIALGFAERRAHSVGARC